MAVRGIANTSSGFLSGFLLGFLSGFLPGFLPTSYGHGAELHGWPRIPTQNNYIALLEDYQDSDELATETNHLIRHRIKPTGKFVKK